MLLGFAGVGKAEPSRDISAPRNGPAADYPMVIGQPFTIEGETYTPVDQLNYDAVGYAAVVEEGMAGITAAHKILPVPSYVEVTSLESGRTILVRIEKRGPMVNDRLVALSPAAAAQLGVVEAAPVRVRRVNPPEPERAMLRAGDRVAERMETPEPLLKVLKRKLDAREPLATSRTPDMPADASTMRRIDPNDAAVPASAQVAPLPPPSAVEIATDGPVAAPPVSDILPQPAKDAVEAVRDGFIVQVAAFSTQERADAAAAKLGAHVEKPGKYWLMRMGPFATREDAAGALEKAQAAGYSDARIRNVD